MDVYTVKVANFIANAFILSLLEEILILKLGNCILGVKSAHSQPRPQSQNILNLAAQPQNVLVFWGL